VTATPQQPPRFRGVLSDAHAQLARRVDAHEQGGQSVPCRVSAFPSWWVSDDPDERAAGHPVPRMTSGPKPPPGSKPRKPPLKGSKPCPFPDCHRPIRARGLCSPHYRQQLAGKKLTVLRDWRPAA
jgi:hypothetical protein